MDDLIAETETIAKQYFLHLGFDKASIDNLLRIAKRDLREELEKLKNLLDAPHPDIQQINHVLHALKGLFFQVGHHAIAEKISEIRSDIHKDASIQKIRTLFGL